MPKVADWSTARGEKWVKHVVEMEAMLEPVDEPLIRALDLDLPYRIAESAAAAEERRSKS